MGEILNEIVKAHNNIWNILGSAKWGILAFIIMIGIYHTLFSCECGALYHTRKETIKFYIHLAIIIILSILIGIFV